MTLEEAEIIYKKSNCSLFVMAREDLTNYNLYKKLSVDKKLEQQWQIEKIEEMEGILRETGDSNIFNRLYDLAVNFYDIKRLEILISCLDYIVFHDIKDSLCIAETIMGRKELPVRSGMIFWAYDIGEKEKSIRLAEKVLSFLNVQTDDIRTKDRIDRDLIKIKKISEELNFFWEFD